MMSKTLLKDLGFGLQTLAIGERGLTRGILTQLPWGDMYDMEAGTPAPLGYVTVDEDAVALFMVDGRLTRGKYEPNRKKGDVDPTLPEREVANLKNRLKSRLNDLFKFQDEITATLYDQERAQQARKDIGALTRQIAELEASLPDRKKEVAAAYEKEQSFFKSVSDLPHLIVVD